MQGNNHPKVNRAYVAKVSGRKTNNAARKAIRHWHQRLQALVTQDRIDLRRVAPVRARVADEHVVGIVRHVGPVPTNPVV